MLMNVLARVNQSPLEKIKYHFKTVMTVFYILVSETDKAEDSPFTKAPTQSLILEREKQAKERAHPPGSSKILSKARQKAEEQAAKKVNVSVLIFPRLIYQ